VRRSCLIRVHVLIQHQAIDASSPEQKKKKREQIKIKRFKVFIFGWLFVSPKINRYRRTTDISHQYLHRSDHPVAATSWTVSRQEHQILTTTSPQNQIKLVLRTER
jgi:hypothetical protein